MAELAQLAHKLGSRGGIIAAWADALKLVMLFTEVQGERAGKTSLLSSAKEIIIEVMN